MRARNINTRQANLTLDDEKYEMMRAAILDVLPTEGEGLTWAEVVDAIAPNMPSRLFPHLGSVRWYSKAVQLDLEARGLIARVPRTKPMRLRRVTDVAAAG